MIFAFWNISGTVIVAANEVPFTRSIATLLSAGTEIRKACGKTIYFNTPKKEKPEAKPASHWPEETPASDPR